LGFQLRTGRATWGIGKVRAEMAGVLELQRQLQDHTQQLAQLSHQLQNMESLLRSHLEEPLHTSHKTPRHSRSPPSASPDRKDGVASCTTEMDIAHARWEALANMIELEEHARCRDVAELKVILEQCKTEKSDAQGGLDRFELQLADLRSEFLGFVKQTRGRLVAQDEVIKDLTSRPCKEFEDKKAKHGGFAAAPAVSEMSVNLPERDLESKMEVRKAPVVASVALPVDSESEGNRLSQTLAHAQSQDILSDSAKRRTCSSSPISRNAYERLGACGASGAGGKSHTISVMQDSKTQVNQRKVPFTAPVAHSTPVAVAAPVPCLTREATTGSMVEAKFERSIPEPPRIMTAARLSPPVTYRAIRTPVKGNMVKQDFNPFVMPSPPAPHVRFASPAPFSRPVQESELLLGTPKIRSL